MKVVFLDRDGVINRFPGHGRYVTRVKDFHFLPGVTRALKQLTKNGFTIFIISNQAGVGRGVFTQEKLNQIDAHMHRHVKRSGGAIKKSFYCTHHPDAQCRCRKPGIENVKNAAALMHKDISDLKGSFFVGDASVDMKTGRGAKLQTILVLSGKSTLPQVKREGGKPDYVVANLRDAVKIVLHESSSRSRHSRSRS